jgi:16S rRNA (uracil1498-N3)-methyltransferase
MANYDFSAPRLYVGTNQDSQTSQAQAFQPGTKLDLDKAQHHYLCNVLRLSHGNSVLVFDGRQGEWRATLAAAGGKKMALRLEEEARAQTARTDLHYLFAPLKHARLDYIAQKAVEMGASALRPVITRRTQAARVNMERLRANAIEAAEQCGIITLPEIEEPRPLAAALADWEPRRVLVFCDEDAELGDPVASLRAIGPGPRPLAVLIGPEGGFDAAERAALLALPSVARLSLGPRVLRADTAGVAALALVQAVIGDWAGPI